MTRSLPFSQVRWVGRVRGELHSFFLKDEEMVVVL